MNPMPYDVALARRLCDEADLSQQQIADRFGVSRTRVYYWLNPDRVPRPVERSTADRDDKVALALSLRAGGVRSYRQVAEEVGVPVSTVHRWVNGRDRERAA